MTRHRHIFSIVSVLRSVRLVAKLPMLVLALTLFSAATQAVAQETLEGDWVGTVSETIVPAISSFEAACREVRSVPVRVSEPFTNYLAINEARDSAGKRAQELAINAVVGRVVEVSAESLLLLENDVASQNFREESSSSSRGYMRATVTRESTKLEVLDGRSVRILTLEFDFTVCVPKTDQEIAEEQRRAEPPKPISAVNPQFFDPKTGAPKIWFSRESNGTLRLFDKGGFDPTSGAPLAPATPEIAVEWQSIQGDLAEQARLRSETGRRCDVLAANPNDMQKPENVLGVSYNELSLNADAAIAACRLAVETFAGTPRYSYQLGRALQTLDPTRALPLLEYAAREGYLAAFDNVGWIHFRSGDRARAKDWFSRGANAGDPSSMFSLASLLDDPNNPVNQRLAIDWYRRAAELGDSAAQTRLSEIATATERERIRREQEALGLGIFLGVVGAIIENAN